MSNVKKASFLGAHIGLLAWILFTAFQTSKLSNLTLALSYSICALAAFFLFRVKVESENA